MTLAPLLSAPLAVQLHVVTIVLAVPLGVWLTFVSRKGSPHHRTLGVSFIGLMVSSALISLFIHRQAPHSPVFGLSLTHLTVPLVLGLSWLAVTAAMKRWRMLHRIAVSGLFFGALVVNGAIQIFVAHGIAHDVIFERPAQIAEASGNPVPAREPRP